MIWKGMGRNHRHRRLLELSTSLQRLVTRTGLHASRWRGSACTARAAVPHIWPPRSSDIRPPSYTPTFCSSNKFLSSQRIPGAQMTNTSEQPRASSKGVSCFLLVQQNSHPLSQQRRASLRPAHTGRLTAAEHEPASTQDGIEHM